MKMHWPPRLQNNVAWAAASEGQRGKPKLTLFVLCEIGAVVPLFKHRKDTMP